MTCLIFLDRYRYDSQRGETVLFGGYDASYHGDTWEWDGSEWTQRTSSGPSARYEASMAYDSAHKHVFLFGGYTNEGGSVYGDT